MIDREKRHALIRVENERVRLMTDDALREELGMVYSEVLAAERPDELLRLALMLTHLANRLEARSAL